MPSRKIPPTISTDDILVRLCDLPPKTRIRLLNEFAYAIEQAEEHVIARRAMIFDIRRAAPSAAAQ